MARAGRRSRQNPDDASEPPEPSGPPTASIPELEASDPDRSTGEFVPAVLDRTVIAVPLLRQLRAEANARAADPNLRPRLYPVIIDVNNNFQGWVEASADPADSATLRIDARARIAVLVGQAIATHGRDHNQGIDRVKSDLSTQYVFADLEGPVIQEVVRLDSQGGPSVAADSPTAVTGHRAIHSIWPDFAVQPLLTRSNATVKADAAQAAFSAFGEGIVWAIMDSGVDARHPHFERFGNLTLEGGLTGAHQNFTRSPGDALSDEFGHGTHVAGIVAGGMEIDRTRRRRSRQPEIVAYARQRDEQGAVTSVKLSLERIAGIAPRCKIVSLKVLDDTGAGQASNLIVAIEHIQRLNDYGRRLRIHGVNMSVGYGYEPEWFACGQSPLCVEVNRLVNSGVVVVVSAGNWGYGWLQDYYKRAPVSAGMDLSISDPGNAELAITIGSTHRESPHVYGVSYFSSKGPTGDGRQKPDLVAPGEKILSCASGEKLRRVNAKPGDAVYVEDSGTSMAAPHVSGAIAAFLSIRREFIGRTETIKDIFLSTATDLKRDRNFQGHGLVDLMRAIQSV
jgi:serine protease AprX